LLFAPLPLRGQQFAVAGVQRDSSVYAFVGRLQAAVSTNDSLVVVETFVLPLFVTDSLSDLHVRTRRDALRYFSRIITPAVRHAILAQQLDGLFANWQGVMIGNGQVWIVNQCGSDSLPACDNLRIYTVNTDAPSVE
jgi:hypothetical protein